MRKFQTLVLSVFIIGSAIGFAQEPKPIQLPPPQTEIGKPLMQALKLRQTSRSFSSKPLPLQELSNLLWAANGINRTDSGKRTAPTARNWQEVDVYVALPEALYLYEAKGHSLTLVVAKDLREATRLWSLFTWLTVQECRMRPSRTKRTVSTLASSPKTFICIAHRKVWQRSFEARLTAHRSPKR